jgi:DNA-binding transcriptional LysR family regulator
VIWEHRLGAVLFESTNGGTRPTMAGQEFLDTALRIVDESDAAFARLKTLYRGESGRLTIGVYASLSTGNLRATLMEYCRRLPDVVVRAVDGCRTRLLCDLAAKAIDVAITTIAYSCWDDRRLSLWSERVIVALPERHPLGAESIIHSPGARSCRA